MRLLPQSGNSRPLLALLLLLAFSEASASVLRGQVVDDETGQPLSFTAVRLEGPGPVRDLLTGNAGRFSVRDLEPGRWSVLCTYLGYEDLERTVDVQPGVEIDLELRMVVDAIELETIDVVGDRNGSEQELQTGLVELDSETLARIPAIGEADPIRALQLLPGVQAASDLSSGLYVRGGGPDQTLILFDGVPVYNPTHAFGLFSSFHPDLIEDVTLYKGAYPAQYGGRLGAVLDVRSLEGERGPTRGRIGVSTIAARGFVEGSWGDRTWALGGRRTYLEPLLSILRNSDPAVPAYYFYDVNGKLRIPSSNGSTDLRFYFSQDQLDVNADENTSIDLGWGNFLVSGTHRRLLGESATATVSAWYSRYRSDTDLSVFSTPVGIANSLRDVSAEATLSWALPPRHRLTLGLTGSRYRFSYDEAFNLDETVDFDASAYDVAAYLEDTWRPDVSSTVRLGLRTRYLSDGDRVRWEPRLSIRQQLSDAWTAKLGSGIYHQVLQLVSTEGFSGTDFYLPIDETVSPSRSVQFVAGLEWIPEPTWKLSAEGYYTDLEGVVLLDTEIPPDRESTAAEDVFVTGGTGWASGVELFAEKRMGSLTGWIGYTLGWTRRTFDEINLGETFPPKYDRRHDLNVVARWERGTWEYGATFVYGTGQAFTPASARYAATNPATGLPLNLGELLPASRNSARLLPYHRMDLSATRRIELFGRTGRLSFTAFNVYSRRNDWFVTFDVEDPSAEPEIVEQLPIIPSVGLELDF